MLTDQTIADAKTYVAAFFAGDASGHDAHHTLRVWRTAVRLAADEGADQRVVALAALLHDVDDHKLSPKTAATQGNARAFLAARDVSEQEAEAVLTAIREVSFSQNRDAAPSSTESACVRDADRLDAIGAIGVARAFAFGGSHGRPLHDPNGTDAQTTTAHFSDKLLRLKDMMCTDAGRKVAEHRDAFTRQFLDEFLHEWDGLA